MKRSRRAFVSSAVAGGFGMLLRARPEGRAYALSQTVDSTFRPSDLSKRFRDLRRHFIFEYYAWYGTNPVEHWDQWDRKPPIDLASNYMPRLGAYDSKSTKVMEQHARWIREAGVGAINLSWWGRGSTVDRLVPSLMDVMRAHDIKVAFHLEPYRDSHAHAYAGDVEYLIREYGEKRRWDAFLVLANESGRQGPVFKSFRTIVPPTETDCHGRVSPVKDHADDETWLAQTDRVRATFARDFDHVTLLADSLDFERTRRSGFDGIAIYDNYVRPETWRAAAEACTQRDLLFSFNINPGFDGIGLRRIEPGSCYEPPDIEPEPGHSIDLSLRRDREATSTAVEARIRTSFETSLHLQNDPALTNRTRGFLLAYINSFNEWHEGHQFEPMKDRGDLTREERAIGYRNPDDGRHRMKALKRQLGTVL